MFVTVSSHPLLYLLKFKMRLSPPCCMTGENPSQATAVTVYSTNLSSGLEQKLHLLPQPSSPSLPTIHLPSVSPCHYLLSAPAPYLVIALLQPRKQSRRPLWPPPSHSSSGANSGPGFNCRARAATIEIAAAWPGGGQSKHVLHALGQRGVRTRARAMMEGKQQQ